MFNRLMMLKNDMEYMMRFFRKSNDKIIFLFLFSVVFPFMLLVYKGIIVLAIKFDNPLKNAI